jgi:hypothetical protein
MATKGFMIGKNAFFKVILPNINSYTGKKNLSSLDLSQKRRRRHTHPTSTNIGKFLE